LIFAISSPRQFTGETQRRAYIRGLRSLVSTGEQDDHRPPLRLEIDAIAGTMVDSQLGNTLADWFHVTRIPIGQAIETRLYARSRPEIAQPVKPASKNGCLPEFDHAANVATRLHTVKAQRGSGDDVTPGHRRSRALWVGLQPDASRSDAGNPSA
jgi:hypothetical protein